MNYLAHVYLSGSDKDLIIGNFIADHVKGKAYLDYPETIQKGILLHLKIDDFTDHHPLFKKNVTLLFPQFHHYSRVIVDMFFDHFLAAQWELYHPDPLEDFSRQFYLLMQEYSGSLPDKTKKILPILSKYNWFVAYQSLEGLEDILFQMSQRTRFPSKMSLAVVELEKNYSKIALDFNTFFTELINFVQLEKENLS
ncbi:MAG: acyl carrier protein phosphodiesterase [Flavobacteriaceae bacterium]